MSANNEIATAVNEMRDQNMMRSETLTAIVPAEHGVYWAIIHFIDDELVEHIDMLPVVAWAVLTERYVWRGNSEQLHPRSVPECASPVTVGYDVGQDEFPPVYCHRTGWVHRGELRWGQMEAWLADARRGNGKAKLAELGSTHGAVATAKAQVKL